MRDFDKEPVTDAELEAVVRRIAGTSPPLAWWGTPHIAAVVTALVRATIEHEEWKCHADGWLEACREAEDRADAAERERDEWKARYESEREIKKQVLEARDVIVAQRDALTARHEDMLRRVREAESYHVGREAANERAGAARDAERHSTAIAALHGAVPEAFDTEPGAEGE